MNIVHQEPNSKENTISISFGKIHLMSCGLVVTTGSYLNVN